MPPWTPTSAVSPEALKLTLAASLSSSNGAYSRGAATSPPDGRTARSAGEYYQATDLLTSQEEVTLGTLVQTMSAMNAVYARLTTEYREGLRERATERDTERDTPGTPGTPPAANTPVTQKEWAHACGYRTEGGKEVTEDYRPDLVNRSGPGASARKSTSTSPSPPPRRRRPGPASLAPPSLPLPPTGETSLGTVSDFAASLLASRHAKQRMVESNMRLVISISRRYAAFGVGQNDLVQEGSLGLMRAADK